jgi:uncharacterized protein
LVERFELLRKIVSDRLRNCKDKHNQDGANQHLYGAALLCGLIAMKRSLDAEICKSAGLLHDLWLYCNLPLSIDEHQKHGEYGSAVAREILTGMCSYSSDEIQGEYNELASYIKERSGRNQRDGDRKA